MRTKLSEVLEQGRKGGPPGGGPHGAFLVVCPILERKVFIIATDGRFMPEEVAAENKEGKEKGWHEPLTAEHDIFKWEHVSVSAPHFCPNWFEMCWVKEQFWEDEETVVQYHISTSDHINIAKTCLHLWRLKPDTIHISDVTNANLRLKEIPRPPAIAVGPPKSTL